MEDDIKKLLEENRKLSKEINQSVLYIRKYIVFSKIFSIVKILIIVIPLVLSFIYLPSVINNAVEKYGDVLDKFDIRKIINSNSSYGDIDDLSREESELLIEKLQERLKVN